MPIMMLRAREQRGQLVARVPVFGPRCVCCRADAGGRRQAWDPDGDRYVVVGTFSIPVCDACRRHALHHRNPPGLALMMLGVGGLTLVAGIEYRSSNGGGMLAIVIGAVVMALVFAVIAIADVRRVRERRREGHVPHTTVWVMRSSTWLQTRSAALAEDLQRLNPDAQFVETREERKRLPRARVIAAAAAAPEPVDPAAAARAVELITKNTPESLAAARAMIEGGEVSDVVVAHRLAELEAVLGRRDLIARLDALRTRPGA